MESRRVLKRVIRALVHTCKIVVENLLLERFGTKTITHAWLGPARERAFSSARVFRCSRFLMFPRELSIR
jgi:hypothetical protein